MTDHGPTPASTITYRLVIYRPIALTVVIGLGVVAVALVLNFLLANPPDPALRLFEIAWSLSKLGRSTGSCFESHMRLASSTARSCAGALYRGTEK